MKLETIPADEGEALLRKPTGIRRVVAAAAAVAFVIGVSAAAALRTPAVVNWPSLWGPGTEKMGADPNRPHKYETLMVDDEGHANPAWWDDDDFPDDDFKDEMCDRSCKSDKDCAISLPLMNHCGICQDFGKDPPMTCGGIARPPIKHAQIMLRNDWEKCLTVKSEDELIIDKCGGGDGGGHRLSTQLFTYTVDKHGVGRISYEHADGSAEAAVRIDVGCCGSGCGDAFPCNMVLWWKEKSGEDLTWDATGADPTWQIKMGYEKEELCMAASGWKNGSPVVAAKCKDIAGADLKDYPSHWDRSFAKQQWTIEPLPPRLP